MSRTYRRKNMPGPSYDPYWAHTKAVKTGEKTRTFWSDYINKELTHTLYIYTYLPKQEWYLESDNSKYFGSKGVQKFHRDGWENRRKKWIKKVWAKRRRQWDRQEFAKMHKNDEYEPIFFTTKIDTWWWD